MRESQSLFKESGMKNKVGIEAWIGYVGMILIQSSYFPQIAKTYSTKNVTGLSIQFLLMVFVGIICFEIYAVKMKDKVYMLSNAIGICTSGSLIIGWLLFN